MTKSQDTWTNERLSKAHERSGIRKAQWHRKWEDKRLVPSTSKRTWLPSGDSYPDELSSEVKGLIEIFSNTHGNKNLILHSFLWSSRRMCPTNHNDNPRQDTGSGKWGVSNKRLWEPPGKCQEGGLQGDSWAASSEDSQWRPEGDYGEGMFRGGDKGTWSFTWHDLLWRVFMQHAVQNNLE